MTPPSTGRALEWDERAEQASSGNPREAVSCRRLAAIGGSKRHPGGRAMTADARDTAIRIIADLPDGSTLDDVIYALHVRREIQAGLEDLAAGRVMPHEAVEEDLRRWRESSGA